MSSRRRSRLFTVLVVLVSLLFMQFAVASYSCPGAASRASKMAEMTQAGMPCAEVMALGKQGMDDEQPTLCHAHCKAEQQSADTYQAPALVALPVLAPGFTLPSAIVVPQGAPLQAPLLMRTTAPPIAVRHCCFRI